MLQNVSKPRSLLQRKSCGQMFTVVLSPQLPNQRRTRRRSLSTLTFLPFSMYIYKNLFYLIFTLIIINKKLTEKRTFQLGQKIPRDPKRASKRKGDFEAHELN
jgi:hypothetical protein